MLSKLLKYEISATARTFLPLYLALVVFALINKVMINVSPKNWDVPQAISMLIYITILIGLFVMTFVVMIQRFYKNLLSDEGYLMFTLPTKPWKHIASKLIVSMMWMVASGIIAIASIMIIAMNQTDFGAFLAEWGVAFAELYAAFGGMATVYILEFILLSFLGLVFGILIVYASIAIGHLFNQHKVLASFGAFIVLNTLTQILFVTVGNLFIHFSLDPYQFNPGTMADFHRGILVILALLAIVSAVHYYVTHYILSKRLNLE